MHPPSLDITYISIAICNFEIGIQLSWLKQEN